MLGMSVAFSAVFRAISAITSGVGQGFTNLMGYSNKFAETVQSLKNALAKHLEGFKNPQIIIQTDKVMRRPNGKIDRKFYSQIK